MIKGLVETLLSFLLFLFISLTFLINLTRFENLSNLTFNLTFKHFSPFLQNISAGYSLVKLLCEEREKLDIPLGNLSITLNCSEIPSKEEFPKYVFGKFMKTLYYKKFECKFFECIKLVLSKKENLSYFLSYSFHLHLKNSRKKVFLFLALLVAVFLLLSKSWKEFFKSLGKILIFLSLPFLILNFIFEKFLIEKLPGTIQKLFVIGSEVFNPFFSYLKVCLLAGMAFYVLSLFLPKKAQT